MWKKTDFGEAKKFEEMQLVEDDDIPQREEEDDETRNSLFEQETNNLPRGSFVGTPLYCTPEMLNENRSGPPTDLWALGVIIY